jgi:hypothetical protein
MPELVADLLLTSSLVLLVWAGFAPIALLLGGSSIERAESERDRNLGHPNLAHRLVSAMLYFTLDHRPLIGVAGGIGLAVYFAVL